MKIKHKFYNIVFITLIIALSVITLYTINNQEPPRFVLFFGRFHPLILHLPIGGLVVTFFIDTIGRMQHKDYSEIVSHLLGFTGAFAIITSFLGYFLSLEGGYNPATLDLHFYTGFLTAVLTIILFWISLRLVFRKHLIASLSFVAVLISISIAGHLGSVLTHGEQFLTEYAGSEPKVKTIEEIDSLRLYTDVVAKILEEKCIQCHNSSKQKGELSLITSIDILKGGLSGESIIAGQSNESLLFTRLLLPIDDEKHMPPAGKTQLTKDEIWLLKYWIDEGHDFHNYAVNEVENDSLNQKLAKYLVFNTVIIPIANPKDIELVEEVGFNIEQKVPGRGELVVTAIQTDTPIENLEVLEQLSEQIVELDLSRITITDNATAGIEELNQLKTLRINSSSITDNTLTKLENLTQLEVLNLYNTSITGQGLKRLLNKIQPAKIYAWQTDVKKQEAKELSNQYSISIETDTYSNFVEESQLESPLVFPSNSLFKDEITISIRKNLLSASILYTLNGQTPDSTATIYDSEIILKESKTLQVGEFKSGWLPSDIVKRQFTKVTDSITNFSIDNIPSADYATANELFDWKEGGLSFGQGQWVGFFGEDLIVTIDLGKETNLNKLSFNCLEDVGSWILYPKQATVFGSLNKLDFKELNTVHINRVGEGGDAEVKKVDFSLVNKKARYVKIVIENYKKLPAWHPSAGQPSWLFVDEIYFW